MSESKHLVRQLTDLLERAKIGANSKYITAKQVEIIYGIPQKTILNRSNLPVTHHRYIPSLRLKGGRRKYFERKVIERIMQINGVSQ